MEQYFAQLIAGKVTLLSQQMAISPRSSGDRASASGAEGRWFESNRGRKLSEQKNSFFCEPASPRLKANST